MVTVYDLARYIPVGDIADELVNANLERALRSARAAVKGAVGDDIETVLPDDPRIDELVLLYGKDFYEERGLSGKAGAAWRATVARLENQLRLERRRAIARGSGA